ncbi:hypothetical protein SNOG_05739 [Parastagonospora nodorum SN15]|uniref:Uncharacterized protein n=1 Tax=Phaeosphaeria nodorum (strain SN15 / ATCC MYA-4574 / FGSC 10173) TaxID=321614 RepID=Q0UR75_PHANO|nr:hypothetical protein SNOG_05739 [Parastagonospora nodorum SN15]EAT86803.1 hypothetical protein SNOG_05739 [Parastagonospora nodorum SN15]
MRVHGVGRSGDAGDRRSTGVPSTSQQSQSSPPSIVKPCTTQKWHTDSGDDRPETFKPCFLPVFSVASSAPQRDSVTRVGQLQGPPQESHRFCTINKTAEDVVDPATACLLAPWRGAIPLMGARIRHGAFPVLQPALPSDGPGPAARCIAPSRSYDPSIAPSSRAH